MFRRSIQLVFLLAPFLAGCIFEPPEECDNVRIVFHYCPEGTVCQTSEHIEQVHLLVFGQDNRLVQQKVVSLDACGTCGTGLNLAPGRYGLVAVGNAFENTVLDAPGTLEGLRLAHPAYLAGNPITTNDSLYLGRKDIVVPPFEILQDTVNFSSIHLAFKILVRGLHLLTTKASEPPVSIVLEGLFPLYTLQQKASGPPQSYYPAGTYYDSSGIFISRFNIFRGNDLDGIFLGLHDNEGNTLERVNMGQLMRQAGIDPDTVGDVTLPLEIVITGMDITIQVSNWETEELEALLH